MIDGRKELDADLEWLLERIEDDAECMVDIEERQLARRAETVIRRLLREAGYAIDPNRR